MKFFDGLYSYELIMLGMRVVLFIVAIWLLIRTALKGASIVGPLAILPFVLVFAGYPSIQSIKFGEGVTEVEKISSGGLPANATAQQKAAAERQIADIEQRASTPQLQVAVANAWRRIGNLDKAYQVAQKVNTQKPSEQITKALVPIYAEKLDQAVSAAPASQPADQNKRDEISKVSTELQAQTKALPAEAHVSLAKAHVALGQNAQAAASVEAARKIDPNVHIDANVLDKIPPVAPPSH
jgi:tetratricopeptide (TPR) repeat protein